MVGDSARHAAVLGELVEWWKNLSRQAVNSRAVLLPVPPGWGRTHLLGQFTAAVKADDALSFLVSIEGKRLPEGLGLQALKLRELLSEAPIVLGTAEVREVFRVPRSADMAQNP